MTWRIHHSHQHQCAVRRPLLRRRCSGTRPLSLRRKTQRKKFWFYYIRLLKSYLVCKWEHKMCYDWVWGSHFVGRFVTPNHKSELCSTPRTPTPFKSAMEKYGPLHPLVSILTWAAVSPEYGCVTLTLVLQFYCHSSLRLQIWRRILMKLS